MIFRRAKLRLSLFFAGAQLALFLVFAIAIYLYVTATFDFDGAADGSGTATAEAGFATLRNALIVGFVVLLVLVPLTSYALASLAMRPVEASFEAQQRFVDDASHELRTPLSSLQAQLELALRRPRDAEEYRSAISGALAATHRLVGTVNDLLVLSRSEHEAGVHFEDVVLRQAVQRAAAHLSAPDRVTNSVPAHLRVPGAPIMLERAILNVLTNAERYSSSGSPIIVAADTSGSTVVLSIVDRGIGLSAADSARAFERFWRADSSRATEGNGLGLSIVGEIVRLHRGTVELDSALGSGTVVRIHLPLSR